MTLPLPRLSSGSESLAKVDGLGWTAGMSAISFGVRIGVRANDAAWLTECEHRLPPGWTPTTSPEVDYLYSMRLGGPVPGTRIRRFHVAFAGASRVARTLDASEALEAFESAVRYDVAEAAHPWVFVHAGVVGINGRAVVVPGTSMSGKSTLVSALVRVGAEYYSDEYAVIDEQGRVHPFARRLSIRGEGGGPIRVSAADLGAATGVAPLPLGAVISTRYEPGEQWKPRPGTPAEAVLALFSHTVKARLDPAGVLRTLARAAEGVTVLDGPRGDADAVARELLHATSSV